MTQNLYIPPDIADKIKEAAVLEDVVGDYISLRHSGSSQVGDCPVCGGRKKLSVTPSKQIWKCFACDLGGKDAPSFLIKTQGKSYPEALSILADRYRIPIEEPAPKPKKKKAAHRKAKFRDEQLRSSGIPEKSQKFWFSKGQDGTKYEMDRYQAATIDKNWNVVAGDDMVLHYLGLDGQPLTFKDDRSKQRPLLRVRWANPALHLDKEGKPIKYKSPYKSGSHLWLPNRIIDAYQKAEIIETLYICEGEKKADKLCLHGMPAVGIMGISNFATGGEMPYVFETLIKKCGIARVVFVLDADWQDISLKDAAKSIDRRPNIFCNAVLNFKKYFNAYYNSGIELEVFFAYGKSPAHKGIDDLLVFSLKGKEDELAQDFAKAFLDREGQGEHINAHNITQLSSYKLREFWHLHSRPAFLSQHKKALATLREFKFGNLSWRYNKETDDFELAEKILPHEQYWTKTYDGEGKDGRDKWRFSYNYSNALEFLRNRGYGLYEVNGSDDFRFIKMEGKVIEETSPHKIKRFVLDFTREIDEPPVLELLLRGGKQYLGPDKLSEMHYLQPEFLQSDRDTMYLFFRNAYWRITADGIEERKIEELPRHIWRDKLIDFDAKYTGKPLLDVQRKGDDWVCKATPEGNRCDMANFYARTSMFHWRKLFALATDDDGNQFYQEKESPEQPTQDDLRIWRANLVAKMVALGYLIHDYTDWANMKAIICMDGLESEVGKSEGGTGKGVWCSQFEHLVPVFWINGKRKNLEDDKHLYGGVDERTQVIYFEDVRVNFDFEQLFPIITRGTWVEKKGVDGHKEEPKKILIDTNHGLSGDSNSFFRRQYLLSFSDYYNKYRRVSDDFGYQLFEEWDAEQWNLYFNWVATCAQVYLRYRLDYTIPQDALERRNLRQQIGENFLDWATLQFDPESGPFLNHKVEKVWACERYLDAYPSDRRYMTPRRFKDKWQKYARYAGLDFNPLADSDGRIKSNGKEYLILADKKFDAQKCRTITSSEDLARDNYPF